MNAIVKVDFRGDTVTAVREGDQVLVAVKPIIERLGLDWEAQRQRITRDDVLASSTCMIRVETPAGQRETVALPLELLSGFLFGIETAGSPIPTSVPPPLPTRRSATLLSIATSSARRRPRTWIGTR